MRQNQIRVWMNWKWTGILRMYIQNTQYFRDNLLFQYWNVYPLNNHHPPNPSSPPSELNVTVCGLHFSDMCSVWYYLTHNKLVCAVHLMGWGWNRGQARGKGGRWFLCTGYVLAELNMPGKPCRFSKCNFIHCRVRSSRLSSFLQFTQYMFVSLKKGYFYTLVGRLKTILISTTKFG